MGNINVNHQTRNSVMQADPVTIPWHNLANEATDEELLAAGRLGSDAAARPAAFRPHSTM